MRRGCKQKHKAQVEVTSFFLLQAQATLLFKPSQVYVMPKYHLHFLRDREDDMRSMLQLALATDAVGKTAAIICPKAGIYTLRQHMYLRRIFVAIYVSIDKTLWSPTSISSKREVIQACLVYQSFANA